MRTRSSLVRLALAALLLAGCAGAKPKKDGVEEVIWPLPPDPPRIRFLRSYAWDKDVEPEKTFFGAIAEFFLGADPGTRIRKPYATLADERGRIFVADTGLGKVAVFDTQAHTFSLWGQSGPGTLARPLGLATDDQGNLYVADGNQGRVACFDPEGRFLRAYGLKGELQRPAGVAISNQRKWLYVADVKGHQIVVYDLEGTQRLFTIGEPGPQPGQFNTPTNLTLARDGRLFVTDMFNFRIQILDPEGAPLSAFGSNCTGPGCLPRSKGIALDSEGHVYVADAAFNLVQIFNEEGQLLLPFGGAGKGPGQIWLPAGVYIDHQDRIYVADQINARVNVYEYVAQPDEDPAAGANVQEVEASVP